MPFATTLPADPPTIASPDAASTLGADTVSTAPTQPPSSLSPSLLNDLQRLEDESSGADLLSVLAAGARHVRPLTLHLRHLDRIVALSAFPREQVFHCSVDVCALSAVALARLRLVHVGPVADAGSHGLSAAGVPHIGALPTLLWQLAMQGPRDLLLPEIAGPVRYRLTPGLTLQGLPVDARSRPLLQRLRQDAATLRELAALTALGASHARRLLNAVYLQAGLMITRSLPLKRRDAKLGSARR